MRKSTYLIIMGLISFGFLTNNFTSFISADLHFVTAALWMLYGFYYYKDYSQLFNKQSQYYTLLFFILLFLSQLTPLFKYNQDYVSTIIANRYEYVFIFFLVLCKIGPTEEDIIQAFKVLGVTAVLIGCVVYFFPQLFVDVERLKAFIRYQNRGGFDILVVWPGCSCAIYYFFILVWKTVKAENGRGKNLLWLSVFMMYIFAMQNRSTLIAAVPCFLYAVVKSKSYCKWIIVCIMVIAVGTYLYSAFSSLIEETQRQLGDTKYNRWQAVYFYLLERDYGFYDTLFGNGRPCAGSAYLYALVKVSKTRLAILSDIGLLGTFYIYGAAMMLFFYRFVLAAIFKHNMPLYLRLYAAWVLLVPTIHCFGTGTSIAPVLLFSILFYNIWIYENDIQSLES